jgi:thymidylate synthase
MINFLINLLTIIKSWICKNPEETAYLDLLKKVLNEGNSRIDRTQVGTKAIFGATLNFDLTKGFPLLTTKKLSFKFIAHELLWLLSGDTNIKYLKDNKVTIWDEWADKNGNLGPIYGHQWRNWQKIFFIDPKTFPKTPPEIITPFSKEYTFDFTSNKFGLIGEKFTGSTGEFVVIKEYSEPRTKNLTYNQFRYEVQFLKTGFKVKNCTTSAIKNGQIKDDYYPSVHGVGCIGDVEIRDKDPDYYFLKETWHEMIARCYDPKHLAYKNYGQTGAFVDNDWLIFTNFVRDLKKLENWNLKKTFPNDYSLDKDFFASNKYSKDTCIWLSKSEQNLNQEGRDLFEATSSDGQILYSMEVKSFCQKFDLDSAVVFNCLNSNYGQHKGWTFKYLKTDKLVRIRIYDQIKWVIAEIKQNPTSRRLLVSAWNVGDLQEMKLQPCHHQFQFFVENNRLSCLFTMRSNDLFLGAPYNFASYALLTHLIANQCGLEVGNLTYFGADAHVYNNHVKQVKEQLKRKPRKFPELIIKNKKESIFDYSIMDFEIVDYNPLKPIKAPVAI